MRVNRPTQEMGVDGEDKRAHGRGLRCQHSMCRRMKSSWMANENELSLAYPLQLSCLFILKKHTNQPSFDCTSKSCLLSLSHFIAKFLQIFLCPHHFHILSAHPLLNLLRLLSFALFLSRHCTFPPQCCTLSSHWLSSASTSAPPLLSLPARMSHH